MREEERRERAEGEGRGQGYKKQVVNTATEGLDQSARTRAPTKQGNSADGAAERAVGARAASQLVYWLHWERVSWPGGYRCARGRETRGCA